MVNPESPDGPVLPYIALVVGIPLGSIVKSFEAGVGGALGHIALVVGLGTILGKMMVESRGAERIADSVIGFFGPARADWAMRPSSSPSQRIRRAHT